jgi:hypothetical protein
MSDLSYRDVVREVSQGHTMQSDTSGDAPALEWAVGTCAEQTGRFNPF